LKRTLAASLSLLFLSAMASVGASLSRPWRPVAPAPVRERVGVLSSFAAMSLGRLTRAHQEMVLRILEGGPESRVWAATCFAQGTDDEVIAIFNAAVAQREGDRYNQVARWGPTAMQGGGALGDPIILTWSIVPDGTPVPSGAGEADGVSNLNEFMNGIYGSQGVWRALYEQMFARWSALAGVTYVYEPNDDGAPLFDAPGIQGVRGDLRMAGKPIDGFLNILGYNFYPANGGDMVLDTSDTAYTTTGSNSLLLRNVLTHEHGHGMGQNHVCPPNQTKIMEPATPLQFDGPQHDDIRNAQRLYGDPYEPDNSAATATNLGPLSEGATLLIGPTPPPQVPFSSVLSIDANGEQDWFRFSVAGAQRVTVTVTPVGLFYDDSDQVCPGQPLGCCSGAFTNSQNIANLAADVVAGDGATVLETASGQGVGLPETAPVVVLQSAGNYFVRIYETNSPTQTQMYHLSIQLLPALPPQDCPGDANGDDIVNFDDITAVIANWLAAGPAGDANGDGVVNVDDINAVITNWQLSCS
jgi:hypothetical protein